jgi:hypothetical protein
MRLRTLTATVVAVPLLVGGFAAAPAGAAVQVPAASARVTAKKTKKNAQSTRAMGAVAMRAKNTRYSPTTAAARLETWAKRGVNGYHDQCLRLADNAYQPRGGRTGTALSQWNRAKKKGFGHPRDTRPPIGAQMFWRTSNPAGHIATYVGNGKAVTNMPGGKVKKINWKVMNKWGPYLGWAEPYYS